MEGKRTYFLDLQTLIAQLRNQSCMLTTRTVVTGKAAIGYVWLKEGIITSCLIRIENGAEIGGTKALDLLEQCTEWQMQLQQPEARNAFPPAPMSPQPPQFSPTPLYGTSSNNWQPLKLKRDLNLSLVQNLPVKQRMTIGMVFTMINGERSLEEIKARLQIPPNVVDEIVNWLRSIDVIE